MTDLNKYGEIEDDSCPNCGKPTKSDWVACPTCGHALGGIECISGTEQETLNSESDEIENKPALEDILTWLRDEDGPNLSSSTALQKADEFQKNYSQMQFNVLRSAFSWAQNEEGLGKESEAAFKEAEEIASTYCVEDFQILKDAYAFLRNDDHGFGISKYDSDTPDEMIVTASLARNAAELSG